MSDPIIKIQNMNKWFGDFQVLKNINLEVEANKKIVVCGPSGSGKSTLIRCINRLEEHQEGDIIVDGNELSEKTKDIEKIRAEVGSSNNMILGCIHNALAIAQRCCCPPESCPGNLFA